MISQSVRTSGLLITAILAVGGCGGSGGGEAPTPQPQPQPIAGITRTGVAVAIGPVTAFGSVIVNGVSYDTSTATFTVDGQPGSQDDLAIGDMVLVKGSIDDDNTNANATSVEFDDNVEGPVSSVDTGSETMVVLGQTVRFGDAIFDDNCPANRDDLLTVAAVEVSGQVMADGSIDATRIECKNILGEMEVTGTVTNLGPDTFVINDLVVDFTSIPAAIDNFPGGSISENVPVEVKGNNLGAAGELIATRVEFKGARFEDNEGDHIEVEGFITAFVSDLNFHVNGIPVTTIPERTNFEGGTAEDLGLNLKVEVKGEFDDAGVLTAADVEIKQATTVRVSAQADSVSSNSIVMLGITVNTEAGKTRFEDKTGMVGDGFDISNINPGDYLQVRGQEIPTGSGEVFALIVERDDPDTEAIIQGFIETDPATTRPSITVLGTTIVAIDGVTIYRNDDETVIADPEEFWGRISVGSLIKAQGTEDMAQPRTLNAEEIEIQIE